MKSFSFIMCSRYFYQVTAVSDCNEIPSFFLRACRTSFPFWEAISFCVLTHAHTVYLLLVASSAVNLVLSCHGKQKDQFQPQNVRFEPLG